MVSVTDIIVLGKRPSVEGGWIEGVPYVPGQRRVGLFGEARFSLSTGIRDADYTSKWNSNFLEPVPVTPERLLWRDVPFWLKYDLYR